MPMTSTDINKIEKLLTVFKDEIKEEFRNQLGAQAENFQHKLDLVVEGHQMLHEKIDSVKKDLGNRIGCVENKLGSVLAELSEVKAKGEHTAAKIDAVAADLTAHRRDTEAHKTMYQVKEP